MTNKLQEQAKAAKVKCFITKMDWAIRAAKKKKEFRKGGSRSIIESINKLNEASMESSLLLTNKYKDIHKWLDMNLDIVSQISKSGNALPVLQKKHKPAFFTQTSKPLDLLESSSAKVKPTENNKTTLNSENGKDKEKSVVPIVEEPSLLNISKHLLDTEDNSDGPNINQILKEEKGKRDKQTNNIKPISLNKPDLNTSREKIQSKQEQILTDKPAVPKSVVSTTKQISNEKTPFTENHISDSRGKMDDSEISKVLIPEYIKNDHIGPDIAKTEIPAYAVTLTDNFPRSANETFNFHTSSSKSSPINKHTILDSSILQPKTIRKEDATQVQPEVVSKLNESSLQKTFDSKENIKLDSEKSLFLTKNDFTNHEAHIGSKPEETTQDKPPQMTAIVETDKAKPLIKENGLVHKKSTFSEVVLLPAAEDVEKNSISLPERKETSFSVFAKAEESSSNNSHKNNTTEIIQNGSTRGLNSFSSPSNELSIEILNKSQSTKVPAVKATPDKSSLLIASNTPNSIDSQKADYLTISKIDIYQSARTRKYETTSTDILNSKIFNVESTTSPTQKKVIKRIKRKTNLFVPLPDKSDFLAQGVNSFRVETYSSTSNGNSTGAANNASSFNKLEEVIAPIQEESKSQEPKHDSRVQIPEKKAHKEDSQPSKLDVSRRIDSKVKSGDNLINCTLGKEVITSHSTNIIKPLSKRTLVGNKLEEPAVKKPRISVFERLSASSTKSFDSKLKRTGIRRTATDRVKESPAKVSRISGVSFLADENDVGLTNSLSSTPLRPHLVQKAQTSVKVKKNPSVNKRTSLISTVLEQQGGTPHKHLYSSGQKKTGSPVFQKKLLKQNSVANTGRAQQSSNPTSISPDLKSSRKSNDTLTRFQLRQSSLVGGLPSTHNKDELKQKLNKRLSDVIKTQQLQNERRRLDQQKRKSQLEEDMSKRRPKGMKEVLPKIASQETTATVNKSVLHDLNTKDHRMRAGKEYQFDDDQDGAADETLPEIDSDFECDDQNNVLTSWAQEPFFSREILQQESLDLFQIFDRIPEFRIGEVFASTEKHSRSK